MMDESRIVVAKFDCRNDSKKIHVKLEASIITDYRAYCSGEGQEINEPK